MSANTNRVLAMLREHKGDDKFHPLCSMLDLIKEQDATITEKINIYKSIASYTEAQNKQIEYTGAELIKPVTFNLNMSGVDEVSARANRDDEGTDI